MLAQALVAEADAFVALWVAERIIVGNLPDRRLGAVALPVADLPSRTAYQQVSCCQ